MSWWSDEETNLNINSTNHSLQVSIHQTHLLTYLPTLSPYRTQLYIETSLTYSDRACILPCADVIDTGLELNQGTINFRRKRIKQHPPSLVFGMGATPSFLRYYPVTRITGGNDEESNLNIIVLVK